MWIFHVFIWMFMHVIANVCHNFQTELTDSIAMMVGNNDRIQGIICQLEETCRAIEVSCTVCVPVPWQKYWVSPGYWCWKWEQTLSNTHIGVNETGRQDTGLLPASHRHILGAFMTYKVTKESLFFSRACIWLTANPAWKRKQMASRTEAAFLIRLLMT